MVPGTSAKDPPSELAHSKYLVVGNIGRASGRAVTADEDDDLDCVPRLAQR